MKKLTSILTALLLMVVVLQANSKKVDEQMLNQETIQEIENSGIIKGNTFMDYSKPGAPIDIEFNTTKVDINQSSDVNISLVTTVQTGTLFVHLTLDENLTTIKPLDENLSFNISADTQKFFINFQVKSEQEGLYYIRLLTKVDQEHGLKFRSFAVPVYIGEKPKVLTREISPSMKALSNGENISVSKAVETIEIIKEK